MPIFQDERERTKALRVKNSSLAMACGRVGYVALFQPDKLLDL